MTWLEEAYATTSRVTSVSFHRSVFQSVLSLGAEECQINSHLTGCRYIDVVFK